MMQPCDRTNAVDLASVYCELSNILPMDSSLGCSDLEWGGVSVRGFDCAAPDCESRKWVIYYRTA